MHSLFPGRDEEAGTDPAFDLMLERALERSERAPIAEARHASLDDRIKRGVERIAPPSKERTPLLKAYWVLIALLLLILVATLCNRRQETPAATPAVQPTPAKMLSTPTGRPIFLPPIGPAPRAQLVRTPPLELGVYHAYKLPLAWGGGSVEARYLGVKELFSQIPPHPVPGDMWKVTETGASWVYCTPFGYNHPVWIDP